MIELKEENLGKYAWMAYQECLKKFNHVKDVDLVHEAYYQRSKYVLGNGKFNDDFKESYNAAWEKLSYFLETHKGT